MTKNHNSLTERRTLKGEKLSNKDTEIELISVPSVHHQFFASSEMQLNNISLKTNKKENRLRSVSKRHGLNLLFTSRMRNQHATLTKRR